MIDRGLSIDNVKEPHLHNAPYHGKRPAGGMKSVPDPSFMSSSKSIKDEPLHASHEHDKIRSIGRNSSAIPPGACGSTHSTWTDWKET